MSGLEVEELSSPEEGLGLLGTFHLQFPAQDDTGGSSGAKICLSPLEIHPCLTPSFHGGETPWFKFSFQIFKAQKSTLKEEKNCNLAPFNRSCVLVSCTFPLPVAPCFSKQSPQRCGKGIEMLLAAKPPEFFVIDPKYLLPLHQHEVTLISSQGCCRGFFWCLSVSCLPSLPPQLVLLEVLSLREAAPCVVIWELFGG